MAPKECYDGADVVLALDIADFEGPTHVRDIATRTVVNMVPQTATWIDIGFTDVEVSKWSMDYGRTLHAHHRMTADPVIGTPQLVALLQERIGRNADLAGKIAARAAETGKRHQRLSKSVNRVATVARSVSRRASRSPSFVFSAPIWSNIVCVVLGMVAFSSFRSDRNDQSRWRLIVGCEIFNQIMQALTTLTADAIWVLRQKSRRPRTRSFRWIFWRRKTAASLAIPGQDQSSA
jgi:hypothetical protein